MARVNGTTGVVTWDNAATVGIVKWSLNLVAKLPDTTGMDSSGRENCIEGLTNWSATVRLHYDTDSEVLFNNLGGNGLEARIYPGHGGLLVLVTDGGANSVTYSGQAIVRSVRPIVEVSGTVDFEITFQGNGVMTPS